MKFLKLVVLSLGLMAGSVLAAVDINTATQSQLESLKGIGPAKAQAIIEYRKANGGFKKVDELAKVPGIGPKTVEALRPELSAGSKP
jgi:competence protein ComEA